MIARRAKGNMKAAYLERRCCCYFVLWVVRGFFSDDRDRNFTVKRLPGTLSSRLRRPDDR